MYSNSNGVPKNESLASEMYRKAAKQGDMKAHWLMGVMYDKGEGVPQYPSIAAEWHRTAAGAEGGSPFNYVPAQNSLGDMYAAGRGVPKNEHRAAAWYQKAAEQGDADAAVTLGIMYDEGRGVPQDAAAAAEWWRKAAGRRHGGAGGRMVGGGGGGNVEKAVTADVFAMYKLGVAFASGRGVDRNLTEALRWLHRVDARDEVLARDAIKTVLRMRRRDHNARQEAPLSPLDTLSPVPIGARVELRGLGEHNTRLEGQRGIVTRFVIASGRCSVRLEDGRGPFNFQSKCLVEV